MHKQHLYLLVGYPGAGKTTVSRIIADSTGAVHLWADKKRLEMFKEPTHSPTESSELYKYLNQETDKLLSEGKSIIFDTNFNFYKDREHLRQIAKQHEVETTVVWMVTPKEIAKQRAVHDRNLRNGYEFPLTDYHFERMAGNLEPPHDDENVIKIDGTEIDIKNVKRLLSL